MYQDLDEKAGANPAAWVQANRARGLPPFQSPLHLTLLNSELLAIAAGKHWRENHSQDRLGRRCGMT